MRLADAIVCFESHRQKAQQLGAQDIADYFVLTARAMVLLSHMDPLLEVAKQEAQG